MGIFLDLKTLAARGLGILLDLKSLTARGWVQLVIIAKTETSVISMTFVWAWNSLV